MKKNRDSRYDTVVRRVPRGKVATYGQIATIAGFPHHARQVGHALRSLPEGSRVPWHRIINASGRVSERAHPGSSDLQRLLLADEGVSFSASGRIDLQTFQWDEDEEE